MNQVNKLTQIIKSDDYQEHFRIELMKEFGVDGHQANFICDKKLSHEFIERLAARLHQYHGQLHEYKFWYCEPIQKYRLVFGYDRRFKKYKR